MAQSRKPESKLVLTELDYFHFLAPFKKVLGDCYLKLLEQFNKKSYSEALATIEHQLKNIAEGKKIAKSKKNSYALYLLKTICYFHLNDITKGKEALNKAIELNGKMSSPEEVYLFALQLFEILIKKNLKKELKEIPSELVVSLPPKNLVGETIYTFLQHNLISTSHTTEILKYFEYNSLLIPLMFDKTHKFYTEMLCGLLENLVYIDYYSIIHYFKTHFLEIDWDQLDILHENDLKNKLFALNKNDDQYHEVLSGYLISIIQNDQCLPRTIQFLRALLFTVKKQKEPFVLQLDLDHEMITNALYKDLGTGYKLFKTLSNYHLYLEKNYHPVQLKEVKKKLTLLISIISFLINDVDDAALHLNKIILKEEKANALLQKFIDNIFIITQYDNSHDYALILQKVKKLNIPKAFKNFLEEEVQRRKEREESSGALNVKNKLEIKIHTQGFGIKDIMEMLEFSEKRKNSLEKSFQIMLSELPQCALSEECHQGN